MKTHTCLWCMDGKHAEYLREVGRCVFGCESVVDADTGICPTCLDHSHNEATCEECGEEYAL